MSRTKSLGPLVSPHAPLHCGTNPSALWLARASLYVKKEQRLTGRHHNMSTYYQNSRVSRSACPHGIYSDGCELAGYAEYTPQC